MADAFFNGTHRLPTTLCFPDIDPCPAVQQLLSLPPVRHQLRHKLMKRRGMIRLDKMAELMYCNIFHARRGRLPKLSGKSHNLLFRLTASPSGHHTAHFNLGPCYPHPGKNRIKPLTDFFHLLQAALRKVLDESVAQRGSNITAERLRFDFSHFKKLSLEEIREVERRANAMIRRAIPLEEHRNMPIAEAKALGAMALFGEKYGDSVRVVKFGQSVELCGGTHVANTGNIGFVKIVSESSIAAGIRRIEAITGAAVEDFIYDAEDVLIKLRALFNNAPDVVSAVARSLNENTSLQKQVEGYMMEAAKNVKENVYKHATDIAGIRTLKIYGVYDPNVVKAAVYMVKSDAPENTVLLAATRMNGKPTLTIFVSDDLVKKGMNAGKMIREAAKAIQGGGGGQPGFAQAGGRNEEGISLAMEKMEALIAAEA